MPLEPKLAYTVPPFDFDGLRNRAEDAVLAAVADLSVAELCAPCSTLIGRLRSRLQLKVAEIYLDKITETVGWQEGFDCLSVEAPFNDPYKIASLISSPALNSPNDFHVDVERGLVSAAW